MADSEVIYYCGGVTKPPPIGDPVYTSIQLFASRVREGIRVSWFIGTALPWGVSYVTLYRSTSPTWSDSMPELWTGSANQYLDTVDDLELETKYYYWIILTSVNGTDSIRVGPSSATMTPWLTQTLADLANSITSSQLNRDLQEQITSISTFQTGLDLLDDKYAGINAAASYELNLFRTQLEEEGVARIDSVHYLQNDISNAVYTINGIGAQFNASFAAIITEQAVYADNTSSLASEVRRLEASIEGDKDNPGLSALVEENKTAVADLERGVRANWTLKTQASNQYGTVVAGIGLEVTDIDPNNGNASGSETPISRFIVRADQFAILGSTYYPAGYVPPIVDPNDPDFDPTAQNLYFDNANEVIPFMIGNVDGVSTTVINKAIIADASIDTLTVGGNAITAAASFNKTWSTNAPDIGPGSTYSHKIVNLSVPFSEHKGGKVQISITVSVGGDTYEEDDGESLGCIAEIYFREGGSGGLVQKMSFGVSGDKISATLPISFTHTSGNIGEQSLVYAIYLGPLSGSHFPTVIGNCYITRMIVKR